MPVTGQTRIGVFFFRGKCRLKSEALYKEFVENVQCQVSISSGVGSVECG